MPALPESSRTSSPAMTAGAPADVYVQAAVVVRPDVLPDRPWVMPFEGRPPELAGLGPREPEPEQLGRFHVGAFVNVDPEDQPFPFDPGHVQEPQEELDQRRVTVDKADPVASAV